MSSKNTELISKFNKNLRASIPMDKLIEEVELDPAVLLTWKRFDVIAKYIYGRYREAGLNCDWYKKLYLEHIRVFNGFFEQDDSGKCGKDEFINSFNEVLDSVKKTGFNRDLTVVPIGRDYSVHEGAHRAAACLTFDKKVHCARFDIETGIWDYAWFREKGMEEKWLDAVASQLCQIKENVFVVVVYPTAVGRDDDLCDLVNQFGDIWYRKSVRLVNNGPLNFIRQVYSREPWVGSWKDGFAGAQNKANWCFQSDEPLRMFVVESDLERMVELKTKIRDLFGVENHSVHINDTHEETLHLSDLLLNENSIHFMNHSTLTERKWFNRMMPYYKEWLSQNDIDMRRCCIDGSAVLAAYGMREARDIDFLHVGEVKETGFKEIGSHNEAVDHYDLAIDDIVTNPEHHFYYDGAKFAAIHVIRNMKYKRGEEKDIEDVELIDGVLSGDISKSQTFFMIGVRRLMSPRYVYQRLRFMALKVRFMLTVLKKKFRS